MIDVLHLIQLLLLRFSELAFPVLIQQFVRPVHVGSRRSECNDFLRARAAGEELNDFAPMWGGAITVLLQSALDDFREFRPLRLQPASKLVGQINGHLHVRILGARTNSVNSGPLGHRAGDNFGKCFSCLSCLLSRDVPSIRKSAKFG